MKDNIASNYQKYCDFDSTEVRQIVQALEASWTAGSNSLSTPYWAQKVGHKLLNNFIYALVKADWLTSRANAKQKWGEFSLNQDMLDNYLTIEEQTAFRTKARTHKYKMRCITERSDDNLVKTPSGVKPTGLRRPGFAKCVTQQFKLDTHYISKYYNAVQANLVKSITKMAEKYPDIECDPAHYGIISKELLDYYLFNPDNSYTCEKNISDSRGRAIYQTLKRVFNPISSKDARSMLIANESKLISLADTRALDEIYLFIAELTGSNASSWNDKIVSGKLAYEAKTLHTLRLTTDTYQIRHLTKDRELWRKVSGYSKLYVLFVFVNGSEVEGTEVWGEVGR